MAVLKNEFPDMEIVNEVKTKYAGCYRSVVVSTSQDISHLQGIIKWIAQSPFRPKHKRKNWFIDLSLYSIHPFAPEDARLGAKIHDLPESLKSALIM